MTTRRINTLTLLFFAIIAFQSSLFAQIPAGYYDDAQGLSGDQLKAALHNIIKDHTEYSYNDLRDFILKNTDEDPNNSNNVILIYTGRSQAKSTFGGGANDWNREHVWAKSHGGFGTSKPAGTDAHHIRPSDASVNSTRGNLDFDIGGSPVTEAPGCYVDSDSFEPRDAVKGDVARMIFYMAVRYEGGNGEPDLEVVDQVNTYPNPLHGKLSQLILWNEQDLPDDFEMHRNDVIYYDYQHNRNPFIDHPEYVNEIWGNPSSVQTPDAEYIKVYPNPANNILNVDVEQTSNLNYSIYSIYGNVINKGLLYDSHSAIDISGISSGVYFISVTNGDKSVNSKVTFIKN